MTPQEKAIQEFLVSRSSGLNILVSELRDKLKDQMNPTYELVAKSTASVNFGYGFTRKAWDCFCAIIVYKNHVNLSFPSGVWLSDPKGLLVGSGSRIRHIRVTDIQDFKNADITELISEARLHSLESLDLESPKQKEVQTFVKDVNA